MKKLIYATVTTLAIASFIPTAQAIGVSGKANAPHLVHSWAHRTGARVTLHHFELHVEGGNLSQLSIDLPARLSVTEGILVADKRTGQKIDAKVSVNDRRYTLAFSQPVTPGTILSISLLGIKTPSYLSRTLFYPISGRMVGMTEDIPFGTGRIQTYDQGK